MAKKRKKEEPLPEREVIVRRGGTVTITPPVDGQMVGAHRFTTEIRFGKISAEVFCKNPDRRRELGLPVVTGTDA